MRRYTASHSKKAAVQPDHQYRFSTEVKKNKKRITYRQDQRSYGFL
jgi:hypothetical protein